MHSYIKKLLPNITYNQFFYEKLLEQNINSSSVWLDAAGGFRILPWESKQLEKALFKKAKEVVAVDIEFDTIRKHGTIRKLIVADLQKLPFKNDYFNVITLNVVLEHLKNPSLVVKELVRVLEKRGKIIVHMPNKYGYISFAALLIPAELRKLMHYKLLKYPAGNYHDLYYRCNTKYALNQVMKKYSMRNLYFEYKNTNLFFYFFKPLLFLEILYNFVTEKLFHILRSAIYAVYEKE